MKFLFVFPLISLAIVGRYIVQTEASTKRMAARDALCLIYLTKQAGLCGSVRYRCTKAPYVGYACHCRACHRLTSSAFATCMHVPTEAIERLSGEVAVTERAADSGNLIKATRCAKCGSTLFALNSARPRATTVYVGTLDDPDRVDVTAHIWTKRRLPWVSISSDALSFEEAGDFRRYSENDLSRLDP